MTMHIVGLETATPKWRYTQRECLQALAGSDLFRRLSARSQVLLKRILGNGRSGITTRNLALDPLDEFAQFDPDSLHQRFQRHAPMLACQAAAGALANARVDPQEVDAVIVSTCTGYLCPGLSTYVVERLPLRADVLALDLVGQGCGAAIPNLRTGETLISGDSGCQTVLSVCVEICSAAFYLDDDPGVLVSACLFGDGAAAAVLRDSAVPGQRNVRWESCHSVLAPEHRDQLRFDQCRGMLRNVLTQPVPQIAARYADELLSSALTATGLTRKDIGGWIWHTGGREVLNALAQRLILTEADLRWSREVLSEYGNMSSPSVLFVLQRALNGHAPSGLWWIAAFGAGFSSYGALLNVGAPS